MLYNLPEDTIVAISTPAGMGAVSIVRVSGKEAVSIVKKVFSPSFPGKIFGYEPRKAILGHLKDGNELLDQVLCIYFKKPFSFSGDEMVEINCHGSLFIQQRIVQLLIRHGCRLAAPGEFSMRAFLNGKMDLSQAEAVADLILAGSEASHKMAMNQMRGGFSDELHALREQMLEFISLLELELDFSEEEVEFADRKRLLNLLNHVLQLIQKLAASFSYGNAIKNGISVAIVGKPNVGKSTLLNALLNEEKAIVSEIAGTTRDAIEDTINLDGVLFRFIDTAGLRHTKDEIESKGIEITRRKMNQAAMVVLLLDASDPLKEISESILFVRDFISKKQDLKLIVVLNKSDKIQNTNELEQQISLYLKEGEQLVSISAKTKANLKTFENVLLKTIGREKYDLSDVIVTNVRHFEALSHAGEAVQRALAGLNRNISGEFVAQDIREAIHQLGLITGEIGTEEVLRNIFKNFCIGK